MPRFSIRQSRAAALGAAALGACLALTACGPVQMGSAAIVGGQRITTSTLTTQVANLSGAYQAGKGKIQLGFPASQMPQQVLAWLIRFQVRDELARRNGITVTPGDVQRAISAITASAQQSGSGASLATLAVQNGLPPDLISSGLGRYQAIADLLVNRLDGGTAPKSTAAQQAINTQFNRAQCLAAKALSIKVNPQFGRLDYSQLGVVPTANTLSAPEPGASPSPSPTAPPVYSPPC